jgi:hypothetical protein
LQKFRRGNDIQLNLPLAGFVVLAKNIMEPQKKQKGTKDYITKS